MLDIEQAVLLLEIEPPFDKRDIQLARRRLAKQWHPDIAPPGKQLEHERHLKAVNEAADTLEQLAEESRGGRVTQQRRQGRRRRRAQAPRRGGRARLRGGAAPARGRAPTAQKHDPFGSRVPDHSVVHRYARCLSYPEWGVGSVNGIYFTGDGDDVQQWARVCFQVGIRTVPAGSLQFVDFAQARPGRRARAALHDRGQARAGRGRLRARRAAARVRARRRAAQHRGAAADDARVLAGGRLLRRRARGARLDPRGARPPRARTATPRASTRTWARSRRRSTRPQREVGAAPADASAWERLGRLRLRTFDRAGAREALERARAAAAERAGPARPRARGEPGRATSAPR